MRTSCSTTSGPPWPSRSLPTSRWEPPSGILALRFAEHRQRLRLRRRGRGHVSAVAADQRREPAGHLQRRRAREPERQVLGRGRSTSRAASTASRGSTQEFSSGPNFGDALASGPTPEDVDYQVPDILSGGIAFRPTDRWVLSTEVRWIKYSVLSPSREDLTDNADILEGIDDGCRVPPGHRVHLPFGQDALLDPGRRLHRSRPRRPEAPGFEPGPRHLRSGLRAGRPLPDRLRGELREAR